MNKFKIVSIVVLLMVLHTFCTKLESGKSGVSSSITESKQIGVFRSDYRVTHIKNYDKLGENINIDEFWIENMWNKGETKNKILIKDNLYQFVILLKNKIPQKLSDSLYIIYNDKSSIELGIFNSKVYTKFLKKDEIKDSYKIVFYLKENQNKTIVKTVLFE